MKIVISIFVLFVYSLHLEAKLIECHIDKETRGLLNYNTIDGNFDIFKKKEKLYSCRIKFIKESKNSVNKFNVTGALTEIFKIEPCTQFKKNGLLVNFKDKGYLKFFSKEEAYLKLSADNDLKCKVISPP